MAQTEARLYPHGRFMRSVLFLVVAYVATLFVYAGTGVFSAPDEHATNVFIEQMRESGVPRIEALRNNEVLNVLHPRSTTVVNGFIVPIGFLGLPFWYGVLSAPLPESVSVIWVTPFLVMWALGAWYALMKKYLRSPKLALVATVLLATLPAFWYYAARSLMPNVPFVCLLILSVAVFDLRPWKRILPWWVHGIVGGALVGIAVSFRIFELPWILFLGAAYLWAARGKWAWRDMLLVALGAALAFAPILALQQTLYGSPFATGYTVNNAILYTVSPEAPIAQAAVAFAPPASPHAGWTHPLFPFGIHERLIVSHVYENVFLLMPLFSVFAAVGWLVALRQKKWRILSMALVVVAAWLFTVYGSWSIADNPDPHAVTLANSYSRYWLPVYVLAIPFVTMGMDTIARILAPTQSRYVLGLVLAAWIFVSTGTILRGPDGVVTTRARLHQFHEDKTLLLENTPEHATVITHYADKYLYPERDVAIGLTNPSVIYAMPQLLAQTPLYYFGITLPEVDMNFYQENLLDSLPEAYRLTPVLEIREQTLYRFDRL